MGFGHELWLTLANAQAHGPRGGPHKGMAHLTNDPEERANLSMRDLGRAASLPQLAHPVTVTVNDSSQSYNSAGPRLSLLNHVAV